MMTSPALFLTSLPGTSPDPWALLSPGCGGPATVSAAPRSCITPRVAMGHSLSLQGLDGVREWKSPGLQEEEDKEVGNDGDDPVGGGPPLTC